MAMKKSTIGTAIMALALVTSFAGGISGTIAWYASSTRATISYQGTSISQSESLQIGLESTVDFTVGHGDLGLIHEANTNYYWAKAGTGLKAEAINAFLGKHGFATTELSPVTSLGYDNDIDQDLALKKAPMAYSTQTYNALKYSYAEIKLIFRVSRSGGDVYSKNEQIWITDAVAEVEDSTKDKDIYKALRVHIDGGMGKFIFNPGIGNQADAGSTPVAGLLDLNKDGYYDHTDGKEIIYGAYTQKTQHTDPPDTFSSDYFDDVNNVGVNNPTEADASTFLAKHYSGDGNKGYTKEHFASYIAPKVAEYETLKSIMPTDDNGILTGGKPVAITDNDDAAVAHLTATVYLEGWDHSVVDAAINSSFNLGLQFQVDRAV